MSGLMLRRAWWGVTCLGLLLATSRVDAGGVNLVANGDFENGSGFGQFNAIPPIATLTSWQSTINTSNYVLNQNADSTGFAIPGSPVPIPPTQAYLWGPNTPVAQGGLSANGFTGSPNGGTFLGMNSSSGVGAVSQLIGSLNVGTTYTLSFEYAFAQLTTSTASSSQKIDVSFGSDTKSTPSAVLSSKGFVYWGTVSTDFTAMSASQTLSFLASGPSGAGGVALIDDVRLVEKPSGGGGPVPEPGSIVLAGLGIVCLGARYCQQRRRQG